MRPARWRARARSGLSDLGGAGHGLDEVVQRGAARPCVGIAVEQPVEVIEEEAAFITGDALSSRDGRDSKPFEGTQEFQCFLDRAIFFSRGEEIATQDLPGAD